MTPLRSLLAVVIKATRRAWTTRFALFFIAVVTPTVSQANETAREHRLQGEYLFNFAKFATWPAAALGEDEPLRVALLCPDDMFAEVAPSLEGRTLGTRTVVVLKIVEAELGVPPHPHVVFVSRESGLTAAVVVRRIVSLPILLIGETPGFAAEGGCVGFVKRGTNLRFQINLAATERAGLRLSGQLASFAELVKETK